MSELISVIVPIYNVEKYLKKCVDSILSQTYKNIEVILVDDGSPDKCGEICDNYKSINNRVRVIHKKNGGLSDARNAGIEAANGEYIMFIDSDDYILPDMIKTFYQRMNEDSSEIAECNLWYVDDDYNSIKVRNENMPFEDEVITSDEAFERLAVGKYWYFITSCNKMYRRSLFDEIRFPRGKYNEDEFVAHCIIEKCKRISLIKEPLYCYLQRGDSIMGNQFVIKRLDGAEALLNRADMMFEKKKYKLTASVMKMALSVLRKGCNLKQTDDVKKRIKELKKFYNQIYIKVIFKRIGLSNFLILTMAYLNIFLYNFVLKNIFKR